MRGAKKKKDRWTVQFELLFVYHFSKGLRSHGCQSVMDEAELRRKAGF